MSSISLINISKSYAANTPKAVDDLSIEIADGEFLCLLGPSGCGKTTTLRMLAGLEHPTEGRILIGQTPIVSVDEGIYTPPEKRGLGLVFQSYALWPHLTVIQNVEFGLKLRKVDKASRERTAMAVMRKLGIDRYRDRYPSQLSGGQQQRVAIARALAMRPKVMLFDEITSALDPEIVGEVLHVVRDIAAEHNLTILMVTHQMGFAREFSDRVCFFYKGAIHEQGSPQEIFDAPRKDRTRAFLRSVMETH